MSNALPLRRGAADKLDLVAFCRLRVPEGWQVEPLSKAEAGTVVLTRAETGGFVAIDFKRRAFAPGFGPVLRPVSEKAYGGAGWYEALVKDAIAWLNGVMAVRAGLT